MDGGWWLKVGLVGIQFDVDGIVGGQVYVCVQVECVGVFVVGKCLCYCQVFVVVVIVDDWVVVFVGNLGGYNVGYYDDQRIGYENLWLWFVVLGGVLGYCVYGISVE